MHCHVHFFKLLDNILQNFQGHKEESNYVVKQKAERGLHASYLLPCPCAVCFPGAVHGCLVLSKVDEC